MSTLAIIPARYGSRRLPGKPLSDIHGKPLIQYVWERARLARTVDRVLVATDDERIARAARGFGATVVMTSSDCASGSDRVAEAARDLDGPVVVNVQGDEPMLDPAAVDAAVEALRSDPGAGVGTPAAPLRPGDRERPDVVKVVCDARGRALYFSRAPIPWQREPGVEPPARRHLGVYAYRREVLMRLAELPPAPLEVAEGLEQLRALHHGIAIAVAAVEEVETVAVDTPADLERVRALLAPEGAA